MRHAFLVSLVLLLSACGAEPAAPLPPPDAGVADAAVVDAQTGALPLGEFARGECVYTGYINMMLTEMTSDLGSAPPWASVSDVRSRQGGIVWSLRSQCLSGGDFEIYQDQTIRRPMFSQFPVIDRSRGRLYYLRLVRDHTGSVTADGFGIRLTASFEVSTNGRDVVGMTSVTMTARR